jgi:hypothetical protein
VGGGERNEAGTGVPTGEGQLDVFRFQEIPMAAKMVRKRLGGDAGDADFVQEVGGCAGPGRFPV